MRIGLISDFEGNARALAAALAALRRESPDVIVHAGDILLAAPASLDPPGDTIDLLRSERVLAIPGNHDRYLIDLGTPRFTQSVWLRFRRPDPVGPWFERLPEAQSAIPSDALAWLRSLPEELVLDGGGPGEVYVCHGMPGNPFNTIWPRSPQWDANVSEHDRRASLALPGMARAEVVLCGHIPAPTEVHDAMPDGRPFRVIRPGSGGRSYHETGSATYVVLTRLAGSGPTAWDAAWGSAEFVPHEETLGR